jgi:L-cysteine S-thiosulfotransferase
MRTLLVVLFAFALSGCAPGPESGAGFRLPAGNTEHGLQAFTDLQCNACHVVEGLELPYRGTMAANVTLGGEVTRVRTYGELVTSIINPSHRIAPGYPAEEVTVDGESLMASAALNEVMTVQQLIDLVAFLEARYRVTPPTYDPYGHIYSY